MTLPPIVPWLRICGEAAASAASARMRYRSRTIGWSHDLGQRRHGADVEAVVGGSGCRLSSAIAAEIDDDRGPLDAVLEPVEAVEAAGEHPGVAPCAPRSASASSTEAGWNSSNAGITSSNRRPSMR